MFEQDSSLLGKYGLDFRDKILKHLALAEPGRGPASKRIFLTAALSRTAMT